jgi:hypothetical protein
MERLLSALERRLGRFAPAHIAWWLVGLSGVVYFLCLARPELAEAFILDADAIERGEVWRLVTFLFMPWQSGGGAFGPVFTIFALLFLYTIAQSLEEQWGSFRFDAFYLFAALATVASAFLFGPTTNFFIDQALLLAFALEFPDYQIQLMLILPIRMRWLGLIESAFLVYQFATGSPAERAAIAVAVATLALFCGQDALKKMRGGALTRSRGREMNRFRAAAAPPARVRVCALCGKSDRDDPRLEFRVCDCQEKCKGKLTEYCLEHAKAH